MTLSSQTSPNTTRIHRPWVLWLLCFFQFAAIGIFFAYQNIYYREAGLSGSQIGIINMATALLSTTSAVFWGTLSDRTGWNRYLIAGGALISLLITQAIPYVHSFWGLLVIAMISGTAYAAPGTLVDSTILMVLGSRREDYGRYRMGGSIGYVIAALFAGFLFEWSSLRVMFPAYAVTMAFFVIAALMLPNFPARPPSKSGEKSGIGTLIRAPGWLLFTIAVFMIWIAYNASISFLGVSLSAMGASEGLIGIAITIGAVIEIPIMFFSSNLMRRYGPVRLLTIAMVLMTIRNFLLGMMPAPEWSIAINIMNGLAYPFFWNSAVTLANQMAPDGYSGTAQGLLSSTISLSGIISAPLTGWLFDVLGENRLFLVMAGFCLAALLVYTTSNLTKKSRIEYNH